MVLRTEAEIVGKRTLTGLDPSDGIYDVYRIPAGRDPLGILVNVSMSRNASSSGARPEISLEAAAVIKEMHVSLYRDKDGHLAVEVAPELTTQFDKIDRIIGLINTGQHVNEEDLRFVFDPVGKVLINKAARSERAIVDRNVSKIVGEALRGIYFPETAVETTTKVDTTAEVETTASMAARNNPLANDGLAQKNNPLGELPEKIEPIAIEVHSTGRHDVIQPTRSVNAILTSLLAGNTALSYSDRGVLSDFALADLKDSKGKVIEGCEDKAKSREGALSRVFEALERGNLREHSTVEDRTVVFGAICDRLVENAVSSFDYATAAAKRAETLTGILAAKPVLEKQIGEATAALKLITDKNEARDARDALAILTARLDYLNEDAGRNQPKDIEVARNERLASVEGLYADIRKSLTRESEPKTEVEGGKVTARSGESIDVVALENKRAERLGMSEADRVAAQKVDTAAGASRV